MNSPSPLVPQGSSLEQQQQARSTLKVKIFCALGINVTVLLVLLMQGCKREQPPAASEPPPLFAAETNPPPIDVPETNVTYATPTNATPPPPALVVDPPSLPSVAATEYIILKGDTLGKIATEHHTTVKALQAANPNVDAAKLQIGKKISIPAPSAAAPTAGATGIGAPVADSSGLYKVKSGDTLTKIATEHHTTVKAIQSANNLTDSRIKVGQQLKLPVKSAPTDAVPVAPAPVR